MLVAVPLFGQEIAPRFGFADLFLIAEITGRGVGSTVREVTLTPGWSTKLEALRTMGVEVLLCGGFNRQFVPQATALGLTVFAGLTGGAREAVEAFARRETMPTFYCNHPGSPKGTGRNGKCGSISGPQNRRGMKGARK